jgi:hypothetical protein
MTDHTNHQPTPEFRASLEREVARAFRTELLFDVPTDHRTWRIGTVIGLAAGAVATLTIGLVLGTSTGYASAEVILKERGETVSVRPGLAVLKNIPPLIFSCGEPPRVAQLPQRQQGAPAIKLPAASMTSTETIAFSVDTTSAELGPQGPGVVKSLALSVTYGANRGRADVLARRERPALRLGQTVFAPALAVPGDYYLFDSTGFVLVRPGTKEFFSFKFAEISFNYEGRRDGWPTAFPFNQWTWETIADKGSPLLTQHAEQRIYWHVDVGRDTLCGLGNCSVEELARGRVTIADAPAEETVVAQWFGVAQAIAGIPGGVARLVGKPIRVTTVSSVIGVHRLRDLRSTAVDRNSLVLPAGFEERPWPGLAPTSGMQSSDGGQHWRALPDVERRR